MAAQPRPNADPVDVFGSNEESEAQVVRSLLDSAGIEAAVISRQAPQDVLPGVGGVVVRVPADQAEAARRIIEDYRSAPAAEEGERNSEHPDTGPTGE